MSRFSQNSSPQIMLHYFTWHLFNVSLMVFNIERLNGGILEKSYFYWTSKHLFMYIEIG